MSACIEVLVGPHAFAVCICILCDRYAYLCAACACAFVLVESLCACAFVYLNRCTRMYFFLGGGYLYERV